MFLQCLSTASAKNSLDLNDLPAFAEKYLRIQDKQMRTVALRLNSIQRRFLRERTGRDVVLKARQVGISTVEQARMFWRARTGSVSTMTLGKDEENKTRLRLMWQGFRDNLPPELQVKPKYDNAGLITHSDTGSYQVMNVAGSNGAGRSFSFTDVHLSEVAFFQAARTRASRKASCWSRRPTANPASSTTCAWICCAAPAKARGRCTSIRGSTWTTTGCRCCPAK